MALTDNSGEPPDWSELLKLSTLTLATVGSTGKPHAAPVYFVAVCEDLLEIGKSLQLYFFSDPASQHAQDLTYRSEAAAAIYPEVDTWQGIRGLQMHGVVQVVLPGREWELAWAKYQAKFPFTSAFKQVVALNRLYVFRPDWIRMLDNRRGFGFKEEWSLS
jgi:uncharacterized protein YhbP (UPF0306 family)